MNVDENHCTRTETYYINSNGNDLRKLEISHYSHFFEHHLLVFGSAKSKFEETSIGKRFALRNIASIIKLITFEFFGSGI